MEEVGQPELQTRNLKGTRGPLEETRTMSYCFSINE
jgi:hypothetical protein